MTRLAELEKTPTAAVDVDDQALNVLLPLHMVLDADGHIQRSGPTVPRLLDQSEVVGKQVFDLLQVRRPRGVVDMGTLLSQSGQKLSVEVVGLEGHTLKGVAVALPETRGAILDLSLGAGVTDVVAQRNLRNKDFSPADPTVEMLWLLGAQAIFMAESKSLNKRLQGAKTVAEEQAYTDSLTGLANRRALERHIARLLRRNRAGAFAVMQIDLDFFKQVNDTYGHAAGDHVLKTVSERLLDVMRPTDMVARIGGDEFVIVVSDFHDETTLSDIGERIIRTVGKPIPFEDIRCKVGASIGACIVSSSADTGAEDILSAADRALYLSKEQGRGRYNLDRES